MFGWDPANAAKHFAKHGVSFEEATTVFVDLAALDGPDLSHSIDEPRFLRIGRSLVGRVLVVSYTVRSTEHDEEEIRIISARRASRKERRAYEAAH